MSRARVDPWVVVLAAEVVNALVGFVVLIRFARVLGPSAFSTIETAGLLTGLFLVAVRGGIESIAIREAARRPRLVPAISETLIALKLAIATASILILSILSYLLVHESWREVVLASTLLVPSALCFDVGPRALCRTNVLAFVQILRSLGLGLAAFLLVHKTSDTQWAVLCVAIAETVACLAFGAHHIKTCAWPTFTFHTRLAVALLRRGLVASLGRFLRVFLYSADLMILFALLASEETGAYAAARRVVFAMIGISLIVQGTFTPMMAQAWAKSATLTRDMLARQVSRFLGPIIAACIGLILTSKPWAILLFGHDYDAAGIFLILLVARVPFLLLSALASSGLVAIRKEDTSLIIMGWASGFALLLLPLVAVRYRAVGVALTMIIIEGLPAWAGWWALARAGAAPARPSIDRLDLLGCAAMVVIVLAFRDQPVWLVSLLGAFTFEATRRWLTARMPFPVQQPEPAR